MQGFFKTALTRTACLTLAALPPALVAAPIVGISAALAISAVGVIAATLLLLITFASNGPKMQAGTLRRSGAYIALCAAIIFGLLRVPPLSDHITTSARGIILTVAPAMVIVIGTAASIRDAETRRSLIRYIITGPALTPVVMLAYDAATGGAALYLSQWLSGVRVMNTGLIASPNINALVGAFGALASLWLAFEYKARLPLIGAAAGIFYLLISQSQGVLIATTLAAGAIMLPGLLKAGVMRIAIMVWLISAPMQVVIYGGLEGTNLGDALTRAEGAHLGVGTGRAIIWSAAIEEVARNPASYLMGTGYMSAPGTPVLAALSQILDPSDIAILHQRTYSLGFVAQILSGIHVVNPE